jgi:spermidine synthase
MIRREDFTFTGIENLPYTDWNNYFELSTIGNTYEVLWDDSNGEIMMSNTEFEAETYAPFFSAISSLPPGANILSVGYGLGYMLPTVRSAGANLTVIEIDPSVVSLERGNIEDITIIYDDAFTANYSTLFPTQKFDLILWDPSGSANHDKSIPRELLNSLLTEDGDIWIWAHSGCRLCCP